MRYATRMSRCGTETAFEVLARAQALEAKGKEVVHLEIGEPDFDTPRQHPPGGRVKALEEGCTHYAPSPGSSSCARRSRSTSRSTRGIRVTPDKVVVTPGGKPIMFFTMLALLDEGDEVIYPNPGFPIYESVIELPRRQARCRCPCARSATSPSTSTSSSGSITARPSCSSSTRRRTRPAACSTRPTLERDRRPRPQARLLHPVRRDLLAASSTRASTTRSLSLPGHGGAHDRPRRLLEDLRHDRLAAGLRRHARGPRRSTSRG